MNSGERERERETRQEGSTESAEDFKGTKTVVACNWGSPLYAVAGITTVATKQYMWPSDQTHDSKQ